MTIELARGEQALVRLRWIERPTSNFEWEKGRTSDGELIQRVPVIKNLNY